MARRVTLIIMLSVLMTGLAVAQERVAVFDFEPIGVDHQTAQAASRIFRAELAETGKYSVLGKTEMEAKLDEAGIADYGCYNVSCAAFNALALSAEKAVIGSISRLGEKIVVEASLVSAVRKEVIFSDQFTSSTVDDLDVVMRKLAGAIAEETKIESEVGRFAITEDEAEEPRRKKAYITSGASFGFGFPIGDSYSNVDNLKTVAWVMRYEAGNYVLENSVGITWGDAEPDTSYGVLVSTKTITVVPWDIGLRYVFNRESDFTPFIGGGIGLHFIASQDLEGEVFVQGDQAMALHLAGGLYAFQSYDFRLTIEGKYTMVFTDAFHDSGDSSQQFGISIGITRKFEKGEKRGCMSGGCLY
jgi:hypothetical protein